MKKLLVLLLAVSLICTAFAVNSSAIVYGDINCDGDIRISDAILLAQHLARWGIYISEEGMAAADVFYDGKINIKDAVLLAQHLARWGVTLGPGSNPGTDPKPPVTPGPSDPVAPGGESDNEVPAGDIF